MDALRSARRARPSVRRNRVVLIPRRWDHVGDDARASRRPRWLTSPDTGENTYKPLAHRAGNAGCFGVPVVTCLRAFYFCTQGCGCVRAPAFPVPSLTEGRDDASLGRETRRGNVDARSLVIPERAKRESGIHRAASWLRNGLRVCALPRKIASLFYRDGASRNDG
jgi:hypothetical protein